MTTTKTRYEIQSRTTNGVRGWEKRCSTIQGERQALEILRNCADAEPWMNWRCVVGDGVYTRDFELIGNRPASKTFEEATAGRQHVRLWEV